MTARERRPLQVALVHHSYRPPPSSGAERLVHELATALRDAGHRPYVLTSHSAPMRRSIEHGIRVVRTTRLPDAPVRFRGFAEPLTHLPLTLWALTSGGYDVAHAFSPPDALAAQLWGWLTARPAVFTCAETLRRERLAHRRLSLWLLSRAAENSDAVIAPDEHSRAALWRWLAVDAAVLEPRDAVGHERLYRQLLARRAG